MTKENQTTQAETEANNEAAKRAVFLHYLRCRKKHPLRPAGEVVE